jgi:peptidoglycan/xylan/chitin deacetylase (PgdA/CDA1 family)
MIIVRNDDILNDTSADKFKGKEYDRFQFIHKMIMQTNGELVHMPTVLCTEIQAYPEAIELIKEEVRFRRIEPQLHGWEHKDYVHLTHDEIRDMLNKSQDWFIENLETRFDTWATPWGGTDYQAVEVCEELGITLQTTDDTHTPGQVLRQVRGGNGYLYEGSVILHHWWDRGLNLFRLCEVLKHGSWEAAKAVDERGWF